MYNPKNIYTPIKQSFLYIINKAKNGAMSQTLLSQKLKGFTPNFISIFTFDIFNETKIMISLDKKIQIGTLYNEIGSEMCNESDIKEVPPLEENELVFVQDQDNIIVCHLPNKILKTPDYFKDFISSISTNCTVDFFYDLFTISDIPMQYSIIFRRIFKIINFNNIQPFVALPQIKSVPIVSITGLPNDFQLYDMIDFLGNNGFKGKVQSVVYPKNLGKPKSDSKIARVTFHDIESAEKSCEQLCYSTIDGNEIIITMHIPRKDQYNNMRLWKLRINNIPPDLLSIQLYRAFGRYGKVYKAIVHKGPNCYGSVQFFDKTDAYSIEEKAEQATISGYKIEVFHKRKIIIHNFVSSITEDEVMDMLQIFNPISVKISNKKGSRPIVFVAFKTDSNAAEAIELTKSNSSIGMILSAHSMLTKDEHQQNNSTLKGQRTAENTIFFKNLPPTYTQEDLIQLCMNYGILSSVSVFQQKVQNQNNTTTSGYAQFFEDSHAKAALKNLENFQIDQRPVTVEPYTKFSKDEKSTKKRSRGRF